MATDEIALNAHPCAIRAFRDILVPKFLGALRNIKKISFSYAGQLREHYVQSACEAILYWLLFEYERMDFGGMDFNRLDFERMDFDRMDFDGMDYGRINFDGTE
ncbi:MAG: hypothetical protein NC416_04240 [Eubacterium sp.]|nr:hypothetical protein [Eubacterium sp.]